MNNSSSLTYAALALLSELVDALAHTAEKVGKKEVAVDLQVLYLVQIVLNEAANSVNLE